MPDWKPDWDDQVTDIFDHPEVLSEFLRIGDENKDVFLDIENWMPEAFSQWHPDE